MTLKAKFLWMQLLFMMLVALAFYRHYAQTKQHYDLLKDATITEATNRIQETFAHCESMIQILVEEQAAQYRALHEAASAMLASGAQSNLFDVQTRLQQKLPNHTKLHLFVINADNRVEATTYQLDMGLDMNALAGAKRDIESVRLNQMIVLSMPSIDLMTKEYRIYSYGVLDTKTGSVLELGFFDEKISALKQQCIHVTYTDSPIESVDVFADF
ncbi:MAG: hypothetical protein JXK05_05620 [Campylobacterales bacterium]|nr:hypothetical protein [Campylobacterales bacterium]